MFLQFLPGRMVRQVQRCSLNYDVYQFHSTAPAPTPALTCPRALCPAAYHTKCVDPWLTRSRRVCPVCKQRVRLAGDPEAAAGSDSDTANTDTEREPLIPRRQRRTYGSTGPVRARRGAGGGAERGR